MKKIEVTDIIDFLRRIFENPSDNIQIKDEKYFKTIAYRISDEEYIWIHIQDALLTYTDRYITKEFELNDSNKCEVLYFFSKIFSEMEDRSFKKLDGLLRYNSKNF